MSFECALNYLLSLFVEQMKSKIFEITHATFARHAHKHICAANIKYFEQKTHNTHNNWWAQCSKYYAYICLKLTYLLKQVHVRVWIHMYCIDVRLEFLQLNIYWRFYICKSRYRNRLYEHPWHKNTTHTDTLTKKHTQMRRQSNIFNAAAAQHFNRHSHDSSTSHKVAYACRRAGIYACAALLFNKC